MRPAGAYRKGARRNSCSRPTAILEPRPARASSPAWQAVQPNDWNVVRPRREWCSPKLGSGIGSVPKDARNAATSPRSVAESICGIVAQGRKFSGASNQCRIQAGLTRTPKSVRTGPGQRAIERDSERWQFEQPSSSNSARPSGPPAPCGSCEKNLGGIGSRPNPGPCHSSQTRRGPACRGERNSNACRPASRCTLPGPISRPSIRSVPAAWKKRCSPARGIKICPRNSMSAFEEDGVNPSSDAKNRCGVGRSDVIPALSEASPGAASSPPDVATTYAPRSASRRGRIADNLIARGNDLTISYSRPRRARRSGRFASQPE